MALSLAFDFPASFWEIVEYGAELLVIAACIGEYLAEFKEWPKDHDKRKRFERRCVMILIFGLAIGLLGLFKTTQLSNNENIRLTTAASEANKAAEAAGERAAEAKKQAAEANERAALTESSNLVLREKVAADEGRIFTLEKERDSIAQELKDTRAAATTATNVVNNANVAVTQHLDRHLTLEQKTNLFTALNGLPKKQFAFNLSPVASDAEGFANDIAVVLNAAGFKFVGADRSMILAPGKLPTMVGTFGETNSPTDKAIVDALSSMGFPSSLSWGYHHRPGILYIEIGSK